MPAPPRRRWFLPETPDLLGMLAEQLEVTTQGLDAFASWARGDAGAGVTVHDLEHQADGVKKDLQRAARTAFITPLEPEDLFALSQDVDRVLNQAKDVIGESEVMACAPDGSVAEMAGLLAAGMHALADAVARLGNRERGDAIEAAQDAVKLMRKAEKAYRRGMASLLALEDLREVIARRELYRRCSRIAEAVEEVADRVQYAVAKES
jgi:uncharacterized protein